MIEPKNKASETRGLEVCSPNYFLSDRRIELFAVASIDILLL
jgi:hypothetical protein